MNSVDQVKICEILIQFEFVYSELKTAYGLADETIIIFIHYIQHIQDQECILDKLTVNIHAIRFCPSF